MLVKWLAVGLFCATALSGANRHPAYQRARNDIRLAQFLMRLPDEVAVMKSLNVVDTELELAVAEIDKAAILDHRNLLDAPPLAENPDRRHRLEKIAALMRSARADMTKEEDNDRALGNRDAAKKHIDAALEDLHKVATELHWEKQLKF